MIVKAKILKTIELALLKKWSFSGVECLFKNFLILKNQPIGKFLVTQKFSNKYMCIGIVSYLASDA